MPVDRRRPSVPLRPRGRRAAIAAAAAGAVVLVGGIAVASADEGDPQVTDTTLETTTTLETDPTTTVTADDDDVVDDETTTTTVEPTTTTVDEGTGTDDEPVESAGEGDHPDNHGKVVSEAAQDHSHDDEAGNHGQYVSGVARGDDAASTEDAPARREGPQGRRLTVTAVDGRSAGQGAEVPDDLGHRRQGGLHVGVGGAPPRREAERPVGVDAHGLQHGRRLQALRRARAARVGGDAALVEPEQHPLRLHPVDGHAHQVGEPALGVGITEQVDARHRTEAGDETRGLGPVPGGLGVERAAGQRTGGGTEAHEGTHVLQAGAASPFLVAAVQQGLDAEPAPHEEHAGAGRSAELVAAGRRQVDPQPSEVDRHPPHGLGGVDVEEHAELTAPGHDVGHGLDGADLVVAPLKVHRARCRG